MAFYKVNYSKLSKKYHPTAKVLGNISMKKLARRLSDRSTVTVSDCYAVLAEIGDVMSEYMASGYSVEIQGLGNFRYTIDSSKNGKETAEEVSAADINGVRIRFERNLPNGPYRLVSYGELSSEQLKEWAAAEQAARDKAEAERKARHSSEIDEFDEEDFDEEGFDEEGLDEEGFDEEDLGPDGDKAP